MINVENIKKFKTENKTVLIRFDLNVPLASGSPVSDRIIRIIDSIAELKLLTENFENNNYLDIIFHQIAMLNLKKGELLDENLL